MTPEFTFDLLCPSKISFGWGRFSEAGTLAGSLGRRAFIVSGSRTLERNGTLDELQNRLQAASIETVRLASTSREPEVDDVDQAVGRILEHGSQDGDFVVGIGGGSAIDLAKAVSAFATNRHGDTVQDFLEGVGRGLTIDSPPLPLMAVPTTAGTGTEATKNAVISSYDPAFKKSLRSERMVPDVVVVDPELTVSVPSDVTAHTGMDAITQLIESFISCRARPVPQALCLDGLRRATRSIEQAVADGACRSAREDMSYAALLSGMALANSGLGMAHGVAAALGVHCRVPHGLACAVMLPAALRANRTVSETQIEQLAAAAFDDTKNHDVSADAFIAWVESVCGAIGIPQRLSEIGVDRDQIGAIVQSSRGNSMSGNPRPLDDAELTRILEDML